MSRYPVRVPSPGVDRRGALRSLAASLSLIGLAGLAGLARAQSAPGSTPVRPRSGAAGGRSRAPRDVVADLVGAMASGDFAVIRGSFAKDAWHARGGEKPLAGTAFFRWLDSEVIGRAARVENPVFVVNGDEVVVRGQYRSQGGFAAANFVFKVVEGRIVSWQTRS